MCLPLFTGKIIADFAPYCGDIIGSIPVPPDNGTPGSLDLRKVILGIATPKPNAAVNLRATDTKKSPARSRQMKGQG